MAATNSVRQRTGNVSAGTSVFAMLVLEKELSTRYPEIDMVTTPAGDSVAMVHSNNCTSDLNAWVGLFDEFASAIGAKIDKNQLFSTLYNKALEGDKDCGGLLAYGYLSGEHITHFEEGRPLFVRTPGSHFSLANFMRVNLYSALGALKTGLDILSSNRGCGSGQDSGPRRSLQDAGRGTEDPGSSHERCRFPSWRRQARAEPGESPFWLPYMLQKKDGGEHWRIIWTAEYLRTDKAIRVEPDTEDVAGFMRAFMKRYQAGLAIVSSVGCGEPGRLRRMDYAGRTETTGV